ncbi:MAG: GxxExxY protein [Bacteroidetes bacterium]|nr:GxxExxY protein [Bacteroidota bacterium]
MDTDLKTASEFLLKEETYQIIGVCMEVHRELGHGFREIVYGDAIELEFGQKNILFEREKEYQVIYKGRKLQHNFYADFVVFNNIILELKAAEGGVSDDNIAQTLNYLKVSGCKVGLLINFGRRKLEYKRLIY